MAAERPRRRITQPCLEYNGGLLHKEEVMLRRAMYASLAESKKPLPSKLPFHHSTTSSDTTSNDTSHDSASVTSKGEGISSEQCSTPDELIDNNNSTSDSGQFTTGQSIDTLNPPLGDQVIKRKIKMSKEPSKLLNYVIKKKKEKRRTSLKTLLRTSSPTKLAGSSDPGFSSPNVKSRKRRRQRGALAVFVAMNKSAGGKINKNHFSEPEKELLGLKTKKKRRRKRKGFEAQICDSADGADAESKESPVKKSRKEEKKLGRVVHAQRKFAKTHPLSPTSIRLQEERNLLTSSCTRAKTEDFLTFLCLRNNPVLPKELEIFNNPCLPMSPLSEDEEDNSSPPSPTQSQSSISNSSSAFQKSFSDSPAPSVDSPATGEGPCWESGVVRMYADGPKGLAGDGKEQKKYDELLPSDEADDPRDLTKSVTPPLAFRVSSRPTNWSCHRAKDKQLPRPIPKPFAVKPSLTGASNNRTSFSPTGTSNAGGNAIPPPPPLLHPAESSSCSPPPPPLLYIPAAAQRVTHLHGPPTLQRFPSTSPNRERELSEKQRRLSIDRNDGPPPLKRFPPVVIEHEGANKDNESSGSSPNELFSTQTGSSELPRLSSWSPNKNELKVVSPAPSAAMATSGRSSSSLSDLTKISQLETGPDGTASRWRNKEMPLLRRHSSASQGAVCFEELMKFPGRSRIINSSSSPPQLQRVPVAVDKGIQSQPACSSLLKASGSRSETSGGRFETSGERFDTSVSGPETSSVRFETSASRHERFETSGGRPETSGSRFESSGGHLEASGSRFDPSCSRLSPNFPSHPPRPVRHTSTRLGHPEANLNTTSFQDDLTAFGDSNQLRSSPLAFSTHGNPQAFQHKNYARPIPLAEAPLSSRRSPVFISGRDKYKSTYVFSNRQSFVPPEKELRPLQVTSLVMPSKNGVSMTPNRSDVSLMRFQSIDDFRQSGESQCVVGNASRPMQSKYLGPQSYIHRPHGENAGLMAANRQFGEPSVFKRIPSPRSDLLGRPSHEPANSSCIPRVGVPSPGSSSTGAQPMALPSTFRRYENPLESFPPMWSHQESPYSVPCNASRNSPPKPYTLSVSVPQSSPSPHFSGAQSCEPRSNSSTPTLEGYSLAPIQLSDHPQLSVLQCASLNKGQSPNTMQHELHVGNHEYSRTYHLPMAFQGSDSRLNSRTNAIFSESTLPSTSARERLMRQSFLNDHSLGDLNRESSNPLLHPIELPTKLLSPKSPILNRNTSSPSFRDNELHANPPSSKSPKGLKSNVSDLAVAGDTADPKKPCNSPEIAGKKTVGSKNKPAICPSLDKTNTSPVFHPSEEEFKDPDAYIKRIRREGEKFGVAVIVPPESWKPEFQISNSVRFTSECQLIHRLQDRWGPVEEELACIKKHLDQQSISLVPMPQIGGYELDLPQFSRVVKQFGGLQKVIDSKKWTKVAEILKIPRAAQDRIGKLQDIYCKYLLSYDLLPQEEKAELLRLVQAERESKVNCEQSRDSWSVKGRNLSLVPFQRLARNVQGHFFKNPPSANDVEREFWKIVHNRESYVSVHRGTLDTNQEHSCFPTDKADPHSKLGWNLNVLPQLPGSALKHLGFVQDVTIPWLQFDMVFSVKSWQTHPLALYTVDYLHSGAEKIWYCVPAGERKSLASLCKQEGDEAAEISLADKMVSPSSLTDSGVTVTRVVQKQGQFVVVFPEAYYSSISCGYSVSEAVAFAPPDWLLLGSKRYKELRDSSWWSEFSYDKLLLGLAQELTDETQEVVQCLLAELKLKRDEEKLFMGQLLELGLIEMVDKERKSSESPVGKKGKKSLRNWSQADSSCVLFCEECDRPCYLSAVTGEKEPQVLCLKHAVNHIRDKASTKGFRILSRYDTGRLDELVNEVEEKLKKLEAPPS